MAAEQDAKTLTVEERLALVEAKLEKTCTKAQMEHHVFWRLAHYEEIYICRKMDLWQCPFCHRWPIEIPKKYLALVDERSDLCEKCGMRNGWFRSENAYKTWD